MSWVWLDSKKYSNYIKSYHTKFCDQDGYFFCVAAFKKTVSFEKVIKKINVSVTGDTAFRLFINDEYLCDGPACPSGDYNFCGTMNKTYISTFDTEEFPGKELEIYAQVRLLPDVQCEVSMGRGGFYFHGEILFDDGTIENINTDNTWLCCVEKKYKSLNDIDFCEKNDEWTFCECVQSIWNTVVSELPLLKHEKIYPCKIDGNKYFFDKIYSAYVCCLTEADSEYNISLKTYEVPSKIISEYNIHGDENQHFISLHLDSVGGLEIQCDNVRVTPYIIYIHYPDVKKGDFICSDEELNKIYSVGLHTTKICRQTIELDSPCHQENLGCTGDYYIESLIAYMAFGDKRLSKSDILKTAEYMRISNGRMFHTTYSLIWVQMVKDYYMFCGDKDIIYSTIDVISLLLNRFNSYIGENNLIETPPDYMFVDWIPVDEYNMHHPPKCLGQAVLCAFYYNALTVSSFLFEEIEKDNKELLDKAKKLKVAFNENFFDDKRKIYFAGLNTLSCNTNVWLPQNSAKRYYTMHTNALASLYGIADDPRQIMINALSDDNIINVQPYFMHFVLEAVYSCGLFEEYGIKLIKKWNPMIEECDKGMKEAWGDFPGYSYDYSHAWGASPSYHLPSKMSGMNIIEPGMKKISLNPNLYGCEYAEIKIPSPKGIIHIKMKNNSQPEIFLPEGIERKTI